jgi:hypothetical protein
MSTALGKAAQHQRPSSAHFPKSYSSANRTERLPTGDHVIPFSRRGSLDAIGEILYSGQATRMFLHVIDHEAGQDGLQPHWTGVTSDPVKPSERTE